MKYFINCFVFTMVLVAWQQAFAYENCAEPSAPPCIENTATYEEEEIFADCQSNVENYISSMKTYADCINTQSEALISAAQDKADEIVKSFNCRVKGGGTC